MGAIFPTLPDLTTADLPLEPPLYALPAGGVPVPQIGAAPKPEYLPGVSNTTAVIIGVFTMVVVLAMMGKGR